jgi:hypothetical protein
VGVPLYFTGDIYILMSSLSEVAGRHVLWPAITISSHILYINISASAHWAKELQQNILSGPGLVRTRNSFNFKNNLQWRIKLYSNLRLRLWYKESSICFDIA